MPWTAERTTVNQKVQIGAEATTALGTAVAAGKLLECFDWTFGPAADVKMYRPTGHKYDSTQEENLEWVDGTLAGTLDYNGVLYPLAGICGSVSPVAHGVSTVAKDWVFVPPILGSIVPQTYTIQQGDAIRAHQLAYALFPNFGYKLTRKDTAISGKVLAQALSDGITLTSSPTAVALAPAIGKHFNVYLDTTSAGLGTTQLLRVLSVDYAFDNVYGPFYALNRANTSFTAHIDLAPKVTVKLMVEADANGMALLGYLQTGVTYYLRVQGLGVQIDNSWLVTLGTQTTGNFTLTYGGQTTANIAYNATAATVQSALAALSSIPASTVTVSGGTGGPYTVSFTGALLTNTQLLTATFTGLGTPGNASLTNNVVQNTFQHDMAVKVSKPNMFKDDQGIFAIEWELTIVEDPAWGTGTAQKITATNLITAL